MDSAIDAMVEEFEEVTVLDRPMLFSFQRVDRTTVPKGLYAYDVREDDNEQGEPVEIAGYVKVGHWGTLLTNQPIHLNALSWNCRSCRRLNPEKDWAFRNTTATVQEYMKKHPPVCKKQRGEER